MSGHSKWATTKHKKAIVDARRSASFTKLANAVTIAARSGGDPAMNFQLRLAIEKAKSASMPKENIERALRRAQGKLGSNIEEVIYEGYGPGGAAIIISCLTNNRLRTVAAIRAVFNRHGGSLAEAGSVSYLFEKKGQIIISQSANQQSADQLEEKIIESGADDFEQEDEDIIVYTGLNQLQSVTNFFQDADIKINSSGIIYQPKSAVSIPQDKQESLNKLLEALDDLDDVSEVFSNAV